MEKLNQVEPDDSPRLGAEVVGLLLPYDCDFILDKQARLVEIETIELADSDIL